jgi:ATP-dependent DNA helicase DinG
VVKELGVLYHTRKSAVFGLLAILQHFSNAAEPLALLPTLSTRVGAAMSLLDQVGLDILEKISESSLRLCPATETLFADLFPRFAHLAEELHVYLDTLHLILDGIAEEDSDQVAVWEARQVFRRLTESALFCADFIAWEEHPDKVFWFDRHNLARRPGRDITSYAVFTQTPLNIAPKMTAGVFEPLPTVVALSATLRIGKSFDSWMRRMGLRQEQRVLCGDFPSPFPYRNKALLAICTDGPVPTDPRFQEYTHEALTALVKAAGGRTLVLFTATSAMRAARDAVARTLRPEPYTLLSQGDDDRSRLLDLFKTDTNSVLFATDSFWEGVDVPGEALSQVIIVKLPFPVPSEPVFAARAEALEKQGGNSFASLSIPDGVIKFRQGFGRLMRHTGDYGCVVVLDRRLVEKSYGRTFIESIPETKRLAAPLQEVAPAVKSFLEKNAKK